ncbi:MAG TPA: hypothetical protein VLL76_07340 [Candidatus Omnitrophota bacterium]|nr:hypothetical protein [Candidatus Omnitrophota bacterium]
MKTLSKTVLALSGLLLLAGCSALAEDTTPKAVGPGYGPGWRHEQMVQARQNGQLPPAAMMRGPGMMRGQGPGAAAIGPDGKVDTSKLPAWCPYNTASDAKDTAK